MCQCGPVNVVQGRLCGNETNEFDPNPCQNLATCQDLFFPVLVDQTLMGAIAVKGLMIVHQIHVRITQLA